MSLLWFERLAPQLESAQRLRGQPGAAAALATFLARFRVIALRSLTRYMPLHRAEDRVQDLLVWVAGSYARIDPGTSGAYLASAVMNQVRREHRDGQRPSSALSTRSHSLHRAQGLPHPVGVAEVVEARELHAALVGACERLPAPFREVALNVIANGERVRDVAARTGQSQAAVRSQLRRARMRLQQDAALRPWRRGDRSGSDGSLPAA